jgi:ubiquinone/menaquinone biosynthesis C-methylase UbiE
MLKTLCFGLAISLLCKPSLLVADIDESTRLADDQHHACTHPGGYPYREKSDYVMKELDLREGDVVVDVGAGDGWWSKRMAEKVGSTGVVHASEVVDDKVDKMKKDLADLKNIQPYLSPMDGTGLPEGSCDLAFMSKVYHHLPDGERVEYLRHLKKIVKPTGRLCIIERHPLIGSKQGRSHGWPMGRLIQQAEQAGWIAVRCEMMRGTNHYLAIFVGSDAFADKK